MEVEALVELIERMEVELSGETRVEEMVGLTGVWVPKLRRSTKKVGPFQRPWQLGGAPLGGGRAF